MFSSSVMSALQRPDPPRAAPIETLSRTILRMAEKMQAPEKRPFGPLFGKSYPQKSPFREVIHVKPVSNAIRRKPRLQGASRGGEKLST
jgi:hypothetical protein